MDDLLKYLAEQHNKSFLFKQGKIKDSLNSNYFKQLKDKTLIYRLEEEKKELINNIDYYKKLANIYWNEKLNLHYSETEKANAAELNKQCAINKHSECAEKIRNIDIKIAKIQFNMPDIYILRLINPAYKKRGRPKMEKAKTA